MAYVDVVPKQINFILFPDRVQKLTLPVVSSAGVAVNLSAWNTLNMQIGPIPALNLPVQELDLTGVTAFATPNNVITLTQAALDATAFANNVGAITVPFQINGFNVALDETQVVAYGSLSVLANPS